MPDWSEMNITPVNYLLSTSISRCAFEFSVHWTISDIFGGLEAIKNKISKDFLTGKTAEDMEREDIDIFAGQASAGKMSESSSHIGLAYLRQAEDALKNNDSDKCSYMLGRANYFLGYLACAEKFLDLEFSKKDNGRKNGGNATKNLLQKDREEVIRLLRKNKPTNGWRTYAQAARGIDDAYCGYVLKYDNKTRPESKYELLKGWMSNKKNGSPVFPDVYMAFWDNANKEKRERNKIDSRG